MTARKSYGHLVILCPAPVDAAMTDSFLAGSASGPLTEDVVLLALGPFTG